MPPTVFSLDDSLAERHRPGDWVIRPDSHPRDLRWWYTMGYATPHTDALSQCHNVLLHLFVRRETVQHCGNRKMTIRCST